MVSSFREPALQIGVHVSEVMKAFYDAIETPQKPALRDMLTYGGNSYADLRLTINTFGGRGRIDIAPGSLTVDIKGFVQEAAHVELLKEHLQLCENTLLTALKGVEISERLMRANQWVGCENGAAAVEAFLAEKGNAALKLDQGAYMNLKKEFTIQFVGLDASKATKLALVLERSAGDGDLFVAFEHVRYGSPRVMQTVMQQFEEARNEMQALMLHVGLEPTTSHVG
jgi:hypothetical protein